MSDMLDLSYADQLKRSKISSKYLAIFLFAFGLNVATLVFYVLSAHAFSGFINSSCYWDCGWYMGIADSGYEKIPFSALPHGAQANWAFFPAFPLLARLLHALTGASTVLSALVMNNLLFPCLLTLTAAYGEKFYRLDPYLTIIVIVVSPFSLYYRVPLSETLYGLLLMLILLLRRSGSLWAAAVCAAAFTACRPTAAPILAVIGLYQWYIDIAHDRSRAALVTATWRCVAFGAIGAIGLVSYMLFLHVQVGDALAFQHIEITWGRKLGNPATNIITALQTPDLTAQSFLPVYDFSQRYFAICSLVALGVVAYGFYARMRLEATLLLVTLLLCISTNLISIARIAFAVPITGLIVAAALRAVPQNGRSAFFIVCAMFQALVILLWYKHARFLM